MIEWDNCEKRFIKVVGRDDKMINSIIDKAMIRLDRIKKQEKKDRWFH
ncbi:MAG: hypothetical protein ACP5D2_01980 [Candidatus Nanoarchaeia archaeon]